MFETAGGFVLQRAAPTPALISVPPRRRAGDRGEEASYAYVVSPQQRRRAAPRGSPKPRATAAAPTLAMAIEAPRGPMSPQSRPGTSGRPSTRCSTARSSLGSGRRQRVETGATNRKQLKAKKKKDPSVPLMTSAKAQAREKLTPHIGEWKQPPGAAAVDRSAAFRTRRLSTERDRPLQMATWGPTTVPRPGRTWISESQQMQTTLRDAEEIAANESDEFEVIEREKARKAFMINAQNERVTNKARERLAQLALHKYGGVRQMFECLDRNNDKELSLDEFSHALKRRNLEKLFPRRAARVLVVHEGGTSPRRVDGVATVCPPRRRRAHDGPASMASLERFYRTPSRRR